MEYTRDAITAKLTAAQDDLDHTEQRLYVADALDEVTTLPGLRYAPTSPSQRSYVVACNGEVVGQMWRGEEGHVLGGWTSAPLDSATRLGPFHTARAAAAALARLRGIRPERP